LKTSVSRKTKRTAADTDRSEAKIGAEARSSRDSSPKSRARNWLSSTYSIQEKRFRLRPSSTWPDTIEKYSLTGKILEQSKPKVFQGLGLRALT